jgi:putative ABC transport system ATP-binding protein
VTHEEDIAAYGKRLLRFLDGRLESDHIRVKEAAHVS